MKHFNGTTDEKNITCVRTWFDVLTTYLHLRHADPVVHLIFYLVGPAQQWGVAYFRDWKAKGQTPSLAELHMDFLTQWDHPHWDTPEESRNHLLNQEIKQTGSVQSYIAAFRLVLQNVGEMAMADRIAFFKHGLLPALRKRVNHQSDGSQWTNLEDLIKYTVAVALAEQKPTAKLASADVNFANTKPPTRKQNPQLRANGGVQKPATGGGGKAWGGGGTGNGGSGPGARGAGGQGGSGGGRGPNSGGGRGPNGGSGRGNGGGEKFHQNRGNRSAAKIQALLAGLTSVVQSFQNNK